jgi:ribose-phosphate pyrophosphokinase
MNLLFAPLPGNEAMASALAERSGGTVAGLEYRRFPDEESYVRFVSPVAQKRIAITCTLDRPDEKFLPLVYAARTAHELGASSVGLVAPYLSYMRQDRRFHSGEAVTSEVFASLVSREFDWLITVEPHLHRRQGLSDIYGIPAIAVDATKLLADWVSANVELPLFIGPDEESKQWVGAVAKHIGAPYVVARKERKTATEVSVELPPLPDITSHTAVLIDDIISTGRTMIETIKQLKHAGARDCICAAAHAVFASNAYEEILRAGADRVVTTNTIPHPSNMIVVDEAIAAALRTLP